LKAQQADATRGPAAAKLGGASSSDEAAAASATSNPVEGALEEARLISWPAVSSVLGSTAVVLGIVVASTLLILAVNSLLATTSEALFG
jgi:preprotein translocase SecE subunit